ncbi:hypothetical protein KKF34_19125 [Myxococcota bacterium]|nr:hypothetical protein [Myxococcota bacterium]MBU1379265.1 hypothetical protein [Myxococcota bacterium]MBU1499001.1 hypothetical protein [Myxococcota bacterium]
MKTIQEKRENANSTGPPELVETGMWKEKNTGTVYSSDDSIWEFEALYWWKPVGFSWINHLVRFGEEEGTFSTWEGWYPPPGWRKK